MLKNEITSSPTFVGFFVCEEDDGHRGSARGDRSIEKGLQALL